MSDIIANLTPEIRRAQTAPRSPGHRVPSTGGASQPASARQVDQRGGTVRTPIQRAYPEARGAAQRDTPNDFNFLLQRNFIGQNTLTVTRRVLPISLDDDGFAIKALPGEALIAPVPLAADLRLDVRWDVLPANEDLYFNGNCSVGIIPADDEREDGAEEFVGGVTASGRLTDLRLPGWTGTNSYWLRNRQTDQWVNFTTTTTFQRQRSKLFKIALRLADDQPALVQVVTGWETTWFDASYFEGPQIPAPCYSSNPSTNPSAALAGYLSLYPGETGVFAKQIVARWAVGFETNAGELTLTAHTRTPVTYGSREYEYPRPQDQTP